MPDATVVITTKNRRAELRKLLESTVEQNGDLEILVVDDGSTDGTSDLVRDEFPGARLHRDETSRGYIAQRNRAAQLATAPVIVSIDDDAVFPASNTVVETLLDIEHPRVGAVAIPFVNVRDSPDVQQSAPDDAAIWVTSTYRGTAHALRRNAFLKLGGYRESLVHQAEEQDYSLRMLEAGLVTRLGRAAPIHHIESPARDWERLYVHAARNDLLHGWHNVPTMYLPVRLAKASLHWLWLGQRQRRLRPVVRGLSAALAEFPRRRHDRRPVAAHVYRLDHDIRKKGPLKLHQIEDRLPPLGDFA